MLPHSSESARRDVQDGFTDTRTDASRISLFQILFVAGLPLIIGPRKTFYFFARKNKLRGSEFGSISLLFGWDGWG